mmetsp:Transcript_9755/g.26445  ORF Transcript_9755/g.26445 Transcript_9755/m.26445 type:complete len:227 (-) Transcript_9755:243-923(-)
MALSCSKWHPSAYRVPSASNVMSLRFFALAWICAMLTTCLSSAKLGGMNFRRDSLNTSSYSRNASTRCKGVKNCPSWGTSLFRRDRRGSLRCSLTHFSIFVITSRQECVSCMRRMKSMRKSCSFRCPLRRRTFASVAERARLPKMVPSCSGLFSSSHKEAVLAALAMSASISSSDRDISARAGSVRIVLDLGLVLMKGGWGCCCWSPSPCWAAVETDCLLCCLLWR